jgi:hypothetical protein
MLRKDIHAFISRICMEDTFTDSGISRDIRAYIGSGSRWQILPQQSQDREACFLGHADCFKKL